MSHVTNYILTWSCEERLLDAVNAELVAHEEVTRLHKFVRVDELAGGPKVLEANVALLAGNYLSVEAVVLAIERAIEKHFRDDHYVVESVRLFVNDQHDNYFLCRWPT